MRYCEVRGVFHLSSLSFVKQYLLGGKWILFLVDFTPWWWLQGVVVLMVTKHRSFSYLSGVRGHLFQCKLSLQGVPRYQHLTVIASFDIMCIPNDELGCGISVSGRTGRKLFTQLVSIICSAKSEAREM